MNSIVLPRNLYIGKNSLLKVKDLLSRLKVQSPVVITDRTMIKLGYISRLKSLCSDIDLKIFSETEPEPSTDSINKGVNFLKNLEACDSIIALGGGSVIDSAKIISILSINDGECRDYKFPYTVNHNSHPVIAIPTTAGTGSESTSSCVISDSKNNEKMLMIGPSFVPKAAIIDYNLTITLPKRITADTGLDALTHAIEAYLSKRSNLFSDSMALSALRLIGKNLEIAYKNPDDTKAREKLMLAATFAGIAFSNSSVGLVHGMSRPLGVFFHIPHGMSNAMLLPLIMKSLLTSSSSRRFAECYDALGYAYLNYESAAKQLLGKLKEIVRNLEVPTLSEFGLKREDYLSKIETMTNQAIASGSPSNSPVSLSKKEIINLYKTLWS